MLLNQPLLDHQLTIIEEYALEKRTPFSSLQSASQRSDSDFLSYPQSGDEHDLPSSSQLFRPRPLPKSVAHELSKSSSSAQVTEENETMDLLIGNQSGNVQANETNPAEVKSPQLSTLKAVSTIRCNASSLPRSRDSSPKLITQIQTESPQMTGDSNNTSDSEDSDVSWGVKKRKSKLMPNRVVQDVMNTSPKLPIKSKLKRKRPQNVKQDRNPALARLVNSLGGSH